MDRRLLLLPALAVALLVVPGALAADATFRLDADLPLEAEGLAAVQSGPGGALVAEGDAGRLSFMVHGAQGELVRVVQRAYGIVEPGDPGLELTWNQRTERHRIPMDGALLSLEERRPGFTLLVHDAELRLAATDAPLHLGGLTETRAVSSEGAGNVGVRVGHDASARFDHALEAGLHQARAGAAHAHAEGALRVFVHDAVLKWHGDDGERQEIRAHFRIEERPGSIYDPVHDRWTGPGTHTEYVQEHLLLVIPSGRIDLHHSGAPVTLYSERLAGDVEGTLHLPRAAGKVVVTDDEGDVSRHVLAGEDLLLGGRLSFTTSGAADAGRVTVAGDGDVTEVTYGAVQAEYAWGGSLAVAAGLGTLLLALLGWLAAHGKSLAPLGGGAVAAYARVQGPKILEHAGRAALYERIKAHPGIHLQELAEQSGLGASSLNHHLRALERNGYVTRLQHGRYVRLFDRHDGHYARDRKMAASTLRNATSAAIAKEILRRPGVAQCDLAQRLGVAASTVNWHVRRLAQAGLVEQQRDHHYTRYYAGPQWAALPHEEQARLGAA